MSTTMAIPAVTSSGQTVLILKEGSSQNRGKEAQRNNIAAAKLIAEIVKTSLGPRGMDKMLVDSLGDVTITNDGATMLKEIDVQHPAAKMLVEVSKTTDNEVGDGTTSAVVLAGALLEKAEELLDKNVHSTVIVDGYMKAAKKAVAALQEVAEKITPDSREWLVKVARTSMQTKLVSKEAQDLAELVVDAVLAVAEKQDTKYVVDIENVKVEKKPGGSLGDTKLVQGIVLDKEVVHSGMPKRVDKAKIALVSAPFEIEKTEFDAKLNISDPSMMKKFLDEEKDPALRKARLDAFKAFSTLSDTELAITRAKALETLLEEALGAAGRGLHEKVTSVEGRLPPPLVKKLRFVATVRNKIVHEAGCQKLDDRDGFVRACDEAERELRALTAPPRVINKGCLGGVLLAAGAAAAVAWRLA